MGKSRQSADLVSDNNIFIDIVNDRVGIGTTVPVGQFHVKTGPAIVGTSLSTGTASQNLQVTGGAYFSGDVGIGTTTPTSKLTVKGNTSLETLNVSGVSTLSTTNINGDVTITGVGDTSLLVNGNARVTGILTVGTASVTLDESGNVNTIGIITATSFYGDGQYLQNVTSGVGVATAGGTVGTGATILDFRGAGISTVTVSAGIATINITGGGGGGGAVSIGTIAPSSPSNGDLWYSPEYARTFVWYDEIALGIGSTAVWVDAAPFNVNLSQLNDVQLNSLVVINHTDLNTLDVSGISTLSNVVIGSGATDLIVNGDARVTGILTIGTGSITLDGNNNQVNVGNGVTIHHVNGVQIDENTFHSTGLTVNQINATGIITATTFRVGTAVTINSSGVTAGIITATSFNGDGSQLTGIAATTNVRTDSLVVSGVSTTNNVIPDADATRNLGSPSRRWANIYSADLQLSNEGFSNDVDGTWGKYTIQEGENDLYLINRRTGKIYRFVLEEVN